ncbi:hypothetical protein [Methylobacterium gregans]|uniref:hypothetical protein n=1 Tax=Methylobacterium gregans TaxID=374424 RepID=UPI001EE19C16|nr:hypothetical protein [Methylobacterium gregans]MDQ0519519.1 hypothetical protein [Methylobacterium gregans]GLS52840.1 hypothetical protein GCM10007886_10230 [Methylobacterium gregans]
MRRLNLLEINVVAGEVYDELIARYWAGGFSPFQSLTTASIIERFAADRTPVSPSTMWWNAVERPVWAQE